MSKVDEMIFDLMQLVEKELGGPLPHGAAQRVEEAICQRYGGGVVYVHKLPKLVSQVRIASLGTGMTTAAIARQIGKSERQVRRIISGK